ncbi:hypothetical protein KC19_VG129500 [Ceratodon purpureus]|uniref:Uncharacterized protein n=1 Tax=Ceratodon purpureus TaxID=3225 RepID=A0A8T0HPT4_CERPU|nr:hypothetical protein KC19_VG129500 [Ceratodon purpureus]
MHQSSTLDEQILPSLDDSSLVMGALRTDFIEGILSGEVPEVQTSEQEIKEDLHMADVIAELERERRKNVELLGRVSSLEAKLGCEDSHAGLFLEHINVEVDAQNALKSGGVELRSTKKGDNQYGIPASSASQIFSQKADASSPTDEDLCGIGRNSLASYESMVNWMCREDVSKADIEILNEAGSGDDDDDYDDDDDDDNSELGDNGPRQTDENVFVNLQTKSDEQSKRVSLRVLDSDDSDNEEAGLEDQSRRGEGRKTPLGKRIYWSKRYGYGPYPVGYRGAGILSSYKKAPKIALSPMELKRMLESGVLALRNAQSHTMRKIIVFSCLCIRHGCEEFYQLDFNHFQIFQRGEPYESIKAPGEHLLYSHPSGRTKVFIPNRQNPILCPIRIIDEEKEMRPAGASTPSCLFLCIKYGGRTRNLPQNHGARVSRYVRQRMGRNKLKSFGPLMCQMALLVHVRAGSFFFKTLGITLLFMTGFSDDQVRKETKYRNLNLLRKYHRSDESAKDEQLFHPFPAFFPPAPQLPFSTEAMAAPSQAPVATTLPPQTALPMKKPPPLLVRKDTAPVPALVSAKPKPSADRPYRRIPPIPLHLMKVPKRGRKSKNAVKPKPTPLGPFPFGTFPQYTPVGFPSMVPPGWHPGHGFPPPGPFSFPFPIFSPNTQAVSPGPPPPFFPPYAFPLFMLPPYPSATEQELKQPDEEAMLTATESGNDSGSSQVIEKIGIDAHEHWNAAGDAAGSNNEENDILLKYVET